MEGMSCTERVDRCTKAPPGSEECAASTCYFKPVPVAPVAEEHDPSGDMVVCPECHTLVPVFRPHWCRRYAVPFFPPLKLGDGGVTVIVACTVETT